MTHHKHSTQLSIQALQKLERYYSNIQRSRVVLESPHNHKHKGKHYRATLEIEVKGSLITVSQHDTSIHVAVRDAFDIAERKLKSYREQLSTIREKKQAVDKLKVKKIAKQTIRVRHRTRPDVECR